MTPTRSNRSATNLAVVGAALPYVVAVLSIVLYREDIRSLDYYTSGRLTIWDTVTAWATFGAFLLGTTLCWPWVRQRLFREHVGAGWFIITIAALVAQVVAVFVVRFVTYLITGGIL